MSSSEHPLSSHAASLLIRYLLDGKICCLFVQRRTVNVCLAVYVYDDPFKKPFEVNHHAAVGSGCFSCVSGRDVVRDDLCTVRQTHKLAATALVDICQPSSEILRASCKIRDFCDIESVSYKELGWFTKRNSSTEFILNLL